MREHEVFRVAMRILGVVLFFFGIIEAIPLVMHLIGTLWSAIAPGGGFEVDEPLGFAAAVTHMVSVNLGPVASIAIGWYLLFRGKGLLRRVYPEAVTASSTA